MARSGFRMKENATIKLYKQGGSGDWGQCGNRCGYFGTDRYGICPYGFRY